MINEGKLLMPKSRYQKMVAEALEKNRVIAYYPILTKVLGSAKAGLFLGQLLYWYDKGWDKEWIYKTIREIEEELGLSRSEQETAIKILVKRKMLEVKLKGIPRRRHFKLIVWKVIGQIGALQAKNYTLPPSRPSDQEQTTALEPDHIKKMIDNPDKAVSIIGRYWRAKGFKLPSLGAANASMKRDLKAAKSLLGYSNTEIIGTMRYLQGDSERDTKYVWTLETVAKKINHVISNFDIKEIKLDDGRVRIEVYDK